MNDALSRNPAPSDGSAASDNTSHASARSAPVARASGRFLSRPYATAVLALLAVLLLFVWYGWMGLQAETRQELLLFLGRFHILLVHLPIGILLVAACMQVLCLFRRYAHLGSSVPFLLGAGALGAIASVAAGFMLASGGGYNEALLDRHTWWGIAVAVFATAAWLLRARPLGAGQAVLFQRTGSHIAFSASIVCLFAASHFGGSLTHGEDFLTAYMPEPLKNALSLEHNQTLFSGEIEQAQLFSDLVQPVLETRCVSCHNADRTEANLRLDSYQALLTGGDSGPSLIAGQAAQSLLYERITLPRGHDERMPPGGRRPLTEQQMALIHWWISEGAQTDQRVSDLALTPEIEQLLAELSGQSDTKTPGLPAIDVSPASDRAIARLASRDILVSPVSREHPFLQATFVNVNTYEPELLTLLQEIAPQLVWLDLSRVPLSDGDLAALGRLDNLVRLNLNDTPIGDNALGYLAALEHLQQLHLAQTRVTESGLEQLNALPKLHTIFAWGSHVSEEGARRLLAELPAWHIDTGRTIAEPDSIILSPESVYYSPAE